MKNIKPLLAASLLCLTGLNNVFGQVYANSQTISTTATCNNCQIMNAENCVDSDPGSYTLYNVQSASMGESVYHRLSFPETAQLNSKVRILLQDDELNDLYYSSLGNISVSTIKNNVNRNEDLSPVEGDLVQIGTTSYYALEFYFETDFDAIELQINGCSCGPVPLLRVYSASFIPDIISAGKMLDFNLQKKENHIQLNWTISSEENFTDYTIERSQDGIGYESIGTVESSVNSSAPVDYSFNDLAPANGYNYYRIYVTNMDGNRIYFLPQAIKFSVKNEINLYPNPSNGTINIACSGEINEISIYDLSGQLLFKKQASHEKNEVLNIAEWELSELQNGFYKLILLSGKEVMVENLIIERSL